MTNKTEKLWPWVPFDGQCFIADRYDGKAVLIRPSHVSSNKWTVHVEDGQDHRNIHSLKEAIKLGNKLLQE